MATASWQALQLSEGWIWRPPREYRPNNWLKVCLLLGGATRHPMTITEFNTLALKDQLDITWDRGVLEEHTTSGDHYDLLYRLYDFFVEVTFIESTDEIRHLKTFIE